MLVWSGVSADERASRSRQDEMHGFQGSRRSARPPQARYDDALQLGENSAEEGKDGVSFLKCFGFYHSFNHSYRHFVNP